MNIACSFTLKLVLTLLSLQDVGHMDSEQETTTQTMESLDCASMDTDVIMSKQEMGECDENTQENISSKETEPEKLIQCEKKETSESKRRKQDKFEDGEEKEVKMLEDENDDTKEQTIEHKMRKQTEAEDAKEKEKENHLKDDKEEEEKMSEGENDDTKEQSNENEKKKQAEAENVKETKEEKIFKNDKEEDKMSEDGNDDTKEQSNENEKKKQTEAENAKETKEEKNFKNDKEEDKMSEDGNDVTKEQSNENEKKKQTEAENVKETEKEKNLKDDKEEEKMSEYGNDDTKEQSNENKKRKQTETEDMKETEEEKKLKDDKEEEEKMSEDENDTKDQSNENKKSKQTEDIKEEEKVHNLKDDEDLSEEEKFEEIKFPDTLEGFNYKFNSDGQLRDTETDEPFQFVIKPDDHYYNQKRYEALGEILNNHVYDLLESECNLKRIPVPLDTDKDAVKGEPKSFVFASENALTTTGKLMILIHGSGVVRAGQWARRLIINDCLDSGTQIPYIKRAKEEGYEVLVLNTNENESKDGQEIRGSETPVKHALYVFQHLLKQTAPSKHIAIVAHSYGGCVVLSLIEKNLLDKSVFAIAFTDSVHQLQYQLNSPMHQSWLIQRARNWVSCDKELDEKLQFLSYKRDVDRYSAGTTKHEETSWKAMESIFEYLKTKEPKQLQKKKPVATKNVESKEVDTKEEKHEEQNPKRKKSDEKK
ncbi:myb-like protein X isoform X2 [Anneissia japonica]|uniref:myb-like protein X isoform X2 n=1 Tax=Anneissia japonica TaxID=1529436 RepID=UPI0014258707|nr:myb-like protein X isoform X2 [Anneissia japonica]